VGKKTPMQAWVSAWVGNALCQQCGGIEKNQPDYSLACGTCLDCRWFAEGQHPDYFSLKPEESGGRISIEQVRSAIQFLSNTPQHAMYRVIVIWEADCLTPSAANAFLKTLEEPVAESVLIILVTERPSLLLGTIRSRCFQVRPPVSPEKEKSTLVWIKEDEQVLLACQEAWEKPARLCKVVDSLAKSMGVREMLYSLLKMGYIMSCLSMRDDLTDCVGISPREQEFLLKIAEQLGISLWAWIDRIYESIESIQQGIALNAVLLLESLFITRCLLSKQGRQVLDGNSIVSYDQR
jgi:hypothetical protein